MIELVKYVQELQNNKGLGPEGSSGEFCKLFWNDISPLGLKSFLSIFTRGFFNGISEIRYIITKLNK